MIIFKYLSALSSLLGSFLLITLHTNTGFYFLGLSLLFSLFTNSNFRLQALLINLSLFVLNFVSIDTNLELSHFIQMGAPLIFLIFIGWIVSLKGNLKEPVSFDLNTKFLRKKSSYQYLLCTFCLGIIIIPFYLWHSQAYLNWHFDFTSIDILKLFVGTNFLGLWDELFFINIVFFFWRQHFPVLIANIFQACLFTIFLFELGFTSWGPLLIFPFALLQGYIYHKTKSLSFVICIHLLLDLILFLSLISLHYINI